MATLTLRTQLGTITLKASTRGITRVSFGSETRSGSSSAAPLRSVILRRAARLVKRYLSGKPVEFDIPLDLSGLSAFTVAVLEACRRIPRGQRRSYSWIASQIGKPKAVRAVGQALARNPVPIIVPCHRVVRADGRLGGFSGGAGIKRRLLEIEGARGPG